MGLKGKRGLEAVAVQADGTIWTLAEQTPRPDRPYHLFDQRPGAPWATRIRLTRNGFWSAVGADFGPDGRFYLLERRFAGLGFASRLRAFNLRDHAEPLGGEVVYRAPVGRHGNLEGVALWQGADGRLRALMVSDDNLIRLQRSELVEVVLPLARAAQRR